MYHLNWTHAQHIFGIQSNGNLPVIISLSPSSLLAWNVIVTICHFGHCTQSVIHIRTSVWKLRKTSEKETSWIWHRKDMMPLFKMTLRNSVFDCIYIFSWWISNGKVRPSHFIFKLSSYSDMLSGRTRWLIMIKRATEEDHIRFVCSWHSIECNLAFCMQVETKIPHSTLAILHIEGSLADWLQLHCNVHHNMLITIDCQ